MRTLKKVVGVILRFTLYVSISIVVLFFLASLSPTIFFITLGAMILILTWAVLGDNT